MSTDRDTTRVVRSWLEEGVTALPDRVLDAVLDQVPATPQRRPLWRAWRSFNVSNTFRIAAVAAGVLAVAVVGYQLLPKSANTGVTPSTSPSFVPTASPVAPPPTAAPLPPEGPVSAGSYVLDGLDFIIDMPAGWSTCCQGVITKSDFAGLLYGDVSDIVVYADSCHWKTGGKSEPRGAAAIAAAFAAQVPRNATAPRNVTVAGTPAVHVRLTVPASQEVNKSGFVGCDELTFSTWGTATDPGARYQQGAGQIDDLYLLDIDGQTIIFDVITGPNISSQDKADLDTMLESLRSADGGAS
jgi:hypothetical protein